MSQRSALALVADIGGTNTRVALADGEVVRDGSIRRYANAGFADLETVLRRYLDETGNPGVSGVCVAAAGPVRDGVATMTNLDWTITGTGLTAATGAAQTAILNDLQAQGHALGRIAPAHLRQVIAGPKKPGGAMLVVGLGTGMNAAPVHETPWGRVVAASECGHISMPVRTDEDHRLAKFVAEVGPHAHGFAGVEDVLAGRGLERVYAFAAHEAGRTADKRGAEIMADVAAGETLACTAAQLYIHLLGQELGNLALIHLPFGGIYLIGGVARAMQPWFDRMALAAHFRDKGRFAEFMGSFSVEIVEDDYAALTGCAAYLAGGGRG
ncbi:glucokinase [Tabrizicola oligotrophica]|uniref:Glucokinase n=1 Tax=Tabrizicola oligotrophica TaxID=2710650 RepID=A0A6M0QNY4_9RHOB|nr:glucokinase [Tabrizicola oligotrophica]NEY89117.1 glucokinase [Tabrizicola oligotrophica]